MTESTPPVVEKTVRIWILTAWCKSGGRSNHRAWYWAASRERCLEILESSADMWMESGTYTHAIVESFDEGSFLASSEEWFEVPFDTLVKIYGKLVACPSQSPGTCNWGVLWAGTVAGFLVKTGFALAAKHGAPREVLEQAALDSIEEAYRGKIQ